jgi:peptide/nickel transport system permease protein
MFEETATAVRNTEPALVGSVPEATVDATAAPTPEPGPPPRSGSYLRALAWFLAAIVLFVVGTTVLHRATAEIRVAVCVVGLYAAYRAFDNFGKRLRGPTFQTGLWLAGIWLGVALVSAALDGILPTAEASDPSKTLSTPVFLRPDLFTAHPLGTDRFGLDILGGVIHGLRVSLIVGIGAVAIALVIGGMIGIVSGYARGGIDRITDTISSAMLAFPPLIFLLALAAVLKPTVTNVTLALAVISIPIYIRLARANTLTVAHRESVLAARALGATKRRVIIRELVPPVFYSLLAYSFVLVAVVIVAEASLSFLGLSVPRPEPTLGNMIAANQNVLETVPSLVFIPAAVLFLTVLSLNRLGEAARLRWSPREAKV